MSPSAREETAGEVQAKFEAASVKGFTAPPVVSPRDLVRGDIVSVESEDGEWAFRGPVTAITAVHFKVGENPRHMIFKFDIREKESLIVRRLQHVSLIRQMIGKLRADLGIIAVSNPTNHEIAERLVKRGWTLLPEELTHEQATQVVDALSDPPPIERAMTPLEVLWVYREIRKALRGPSG